MVQTIRRPDTELEKKAKAVLNSELTYHLDDQLAS